MKSYIRHLGLALLIVGLHSCTHDSFEGNHAVTSLDTIKVPVDTTGNGGGNTSTDKPCDPDTVYFDKDIMPILISNCTMANCHGDVNPQEAIHFRDYSSVMNDDKGGELIDPFDPGGSKLYEAITDDDKPEERMPLGLPRLAQSDIDLIRKWILQGAKNLHCDDCDTTTFAFQADIEPIFEASCQGSCHAGSNPIGIITLVGHGDIVTAINDPNTKLLERIHHTGTETPMPWNATKLPDCKLTKIDKWVKDGMPNN